MGTLFLVGTPIGNLEDISFRALRILREVDLIAAEDTRHSGKLLKHFDIDTRMISYHGDSPERRVEQILAALGRGDVALISDAGMPGISDPGAELVRATAREGFPVEPVPGPSAVTTAAALSGLVDAGFVFAGYVPRRSRERLPYFTRWLQIGLPAVFFESPHRILASLNDLQQVQPDARVVLCRELTKLHETVIRGDVQDVIDALGDPAPPGEYAVVIAAPESGNKDVEVGASEAEELASRLVEQGMAASSAAREVARTCGISRSDAYTLVQRLKDERAK